MKLIILKYIIYLTYKMNIVTDINNINMHNIFFNEKVKNTVIDNSHFIRINYSNQLFTLTGIFIDLNLEICEIEKYYNKYKYNYKISNNSISINKLIELERLILSSPLLKDSYKCYKLKEQLLSGNIKTFNNNFNSKSNSYNFILKISGVWLSSSGCGLTFKFFNPESIC